MIFEFNGRRGIGFLKAFADAIGSKIRNGYVHFPKKLGTGYFHGIDIHPQLRMMIRRYSLNEELVIRRAAMEDGKNIIVLAFHHFFPEEEKKADQVKLPAVQITTAGIDYEDLFPVKTAMSSIIITVHIEFLRSLLKPKEDDIILQSILSGDKPFLYEEFISPQMMNVTDELFKQTPATSLHDFYFRVKAEELIYLFFAELLKRSSSAHQQLNVEDLKNISAIRNSIVQDLSLQPHLPKLARTYNMSESKMKKLFRQVYGTSIYNYYQALRMKEAARLLQEGRLSVTEVGYGLGFSNLSHFSRLFAKHTGIKPKRFSGQR